MERIKLIAALVMMLVGQADPGASVIQKLTAHVAVIRVQGEN